MAELLGDVYLTLGKPALARANYERSLAAYVGRERSLRGLAKASEQT
jgi:predicted negative regulator of RcsB-dependent stress response